MKNGWCFNKLDRDEQGRLLVTKGTVLTEALIDKVFKFHQLDPIVDRICVMSKKTERQARSKALPQGSRALARWRSHST